MAQRKPERKAAQEQAETEEEEDLGKKQLEFFQNGGIGISQILPNWTS